MARSRATESSPARIPAVVARSAAEATDGWRWWSVLLLLGTLTAVFVLVAALGARQAAHGERVLSALAPFVEALSASGWSTVEWLLREGRTVGWLVTALAASVALISLSAARLRALPVLLLGAAISLATWGQIMLFAGRLWEGIWLYGFAVASACGVGIWCPLHHLPGFPQLSWPGGPRHPRAWNPIHWSQECVLVVLLSLAALLARTYALTELPQGFDGEMMDSIIASRTTYGFWAYLRYGLTANSTGIVHLLPKKLLFDLFGTSVYSLRLSAVIFGFAATPLLYWLVRRMAGVGPAVLGTVLLITAPEQLYWSRIENANFAPIAVLGLVTAHVGLWMVQRCSLWALLAAALWMPASRFFYAPGWDIFAYPLVLYGHALLFVRRTWRTLWYAVPLLCMGLAGWIFSVSLVYSYLDRRWQFADPAFIFGAPAWRMHGAPGFRDAGWLDLVQLQAAAMLSKSSEVLAGMAYHDQRMFSQWFQRACALPDHLTVINGGVVVLCALGLGYLLGQFYERRAFALLAWVGLGILPAVMSDEPTTRRLTSMFPALYAVAAVFVAGAVRLIRARANTALAAVASLLVTIAVAAIALTSLASHFKMTTAPIRAQPVIDVTRPLMQSSDLVLSDLEPGIGRLILLANLDRLLEGHPCYRVVEVKEWLRAALELSCSFDSVPYELVVPKERREELQRRFNPRRVAFFFEDTPYNRPHVDLVRRLFPETRVTATSFADRRLLSMHADAEAVRALHAPAVLAPPAVAATVTAPGALLRGVTLAAGAAAATEDSDSDVVVRGGILVPADGWNRLYLAPECPQATLSLDARPVSPEPQPMLAGVHPFEIRIADAAACRLPLELMIQSVDGSEAVPVGPEHFVSPAVAALPEARAPTVSVYPGYGEAKVIAPVTGRPIDLGIDAGGRLTVLTLEEGKWRLTRYDAQGKQELTWFPEVPAGRFVQGIAVAPDGTVIVSAETWVLIDDPSGKRTAAWEMPWAAMAMDVALAPNGDILLALASRNTIAVYSREGRLRGEIAHFAGGPGHFVQPAGLTVSPAGDMVVIQDDGQVLVFTVAEDVLRPQFVRSFHVDFAISPIFARGSALDDTTLLLPDPSTIIPLTYRLTGERLMTSVPARDLTAKNLGRILQFQVTADHVYALEQSRLWAIAR